MQQHANGGYRLKDEIAIQSLRRKGIHFWIDSGTLHYQSRKDVVTAEDIVTLRRLAPLCSRWHSHDAAHELEPRAAPRPKETPIPLSFAQLAHWNIRSATGYIPIRQVASATHIKGRLDTGMLKDAICVVVDRHESLRTHIVIAEEMPCQEISSRGDGELHVVDLRSVESGEQMTEVQRQVRNSIICVSDYAREPLFLAMLLKLGKDDHVLILALDHMVSDGSSLRIVFQEILAGHAEGPDARSSLPSMHMQYADYTLWQRGLVSGWLRDCSLAWDGWRRTRFPEDPGQTGRAGWETVRFAIDAFMRGSLDQRARQWKTSLVMVVLTGYVALISRWCETPSVGVQVMSNGRTSRLLENTVGYLAFPLSLQLHISGNETFLDLLHIVTREYCWANERPDFCYSYAQTPQPGFVRNTLFNWLPRREELSADGLTPLAVATVDFENPFIETFEWDAEPWILFRDGFESIRVEVGYSRSKFSLRTMKRFVMTFRHVLDTLTNRPYSRLREFNML